MTTMTGDQRKGDISKLCRGYYNANGIKDPNVLKVIQAITQNQEVFKRKFANIPDFDKLMRKLKLNSAEYTKDLTLEPEDKELMPPQVVLISATWDGNTSADLVGKVNPMTKSTSYYFRYKNEDDLSWTNVTAGDAGDGDIPVEVTTTLTSLTPAKTYYVQLIAQNADGTVLSNILTFVTGAAPDVNITFVTDITATTVTFSGTVDPNSLETSYYWAYGRTLTYELGTTPASAGSGTSAVDVTANITGLQFDTLYYVKLVGTNAGGTDTDKTTFRTKKADVPEVEITGDTFRTDISTKLNGTVDPNGFETTYYFEYGINNTYTGPNTPMPATPASVGSGTSPVSVNADITGLIPGTIYHARLVATNAYGTVYSGDLPIAIPIAELSLTGDLDFGTIFTSATGNEDKTVVVGNVSLGNSTARWSGAFSGDAALVSKLSLIPSSGEVAEGDTEDVTVRLNKLNIPVGTYTATLTITDQYAPDPVTLPIAVEVIPQWWPNPVMLYTGLAGFKRSDPTQTSGFGAAGNTILFATANPDEWYGEILPSRRITLNGNVMSVSYYKGGVWVPLVIWAVDPGAPIGYTVAGCPTTNGGAVNWDSTGEYFQWDSDPTGGEYYFQHRIQP